MAAAPISAGVTEPGRFSDERDAIVFAANLAENGRMFFSQQPRRAS